MKRSVIRLFFAASFLIILFATYYYYGRSDVLDFAKGNNLISIIFATISMLTGIFCGCLFRQLRGRDERINILKEVSKVFASSSFWSAIAISPIVFFAIFAISSDNPVGLSNYVLAFQNGFFCESVFRDRFPGI